MRRNVPGHFVDSPSAWRRLAAATWRPGNDPTIYGTLEVDATRALEYLGRLSARSQQHVTITHLVVKAIALTLARHPHCNAFVRRHRFYQRDDVDVFVLVAVAPAPEESTSDAGADLTGVKVEQADRKSVLEIASEMQRRVQGVRSGSDRDFSRIKSLLEVVPPWLLGPVLKLVSFAQYDLNIDLSALGVPRDSFGSVFVTNVGALGLGHAFAPIVPFTRLSVNVAVGRIKDGPCVENGQLVVRPLLPLTATFDHRVIDGYQAAGLSDTFCEIMRDPARHLEMPDGKSLQ